MNETPTPAQIQSISATYNSLVESKMAAGLHRAAAEAAAYNTVVLSGQNGTCDQGATIQFLISLAMSKGASQQGASNMVLPLFQPPTFLSDATSGVSQ